jgi:peptidylprolyl isomerase
VKIIEPAGRPTESLPPSTLRSTPGARRRRGGALALAATLALSACGGGGDKSSASQDQPGDVNSSSSTAPGSTASTNDAGPGNNDRAPKAPKFPVPSAAPAGSDALPGVPAITANATDFMKEPEIAKGTGPAPSGLVVRDLIVGNGQEAVATDSVKVRYKGTLYTDGSVFDASWKRGTDPIVFPLSGVVPGFAGGIVGMKIGGRREIVIPAALGYGDADQATIPAGSVLVFVVDLVALGG